MGACETGFDALVKIRLSVYPQPVQLDLNWSIQTELLSLHRKPHKGLRTFRVEADIFRKTFVVTFCS